MNLEEKVLRNTLDKTEKELQSLKELLKEYLLHKSLDDKIVRQKLRRQSKEYI